MVKWPALIAAIVVIPSLACPGNDRMVVKKSAHSVAATLDRLSDVLKTRGIGITARVDHAAAAEKVGQRLKSTQLLIFGSPKLGTPLMQSNRRIGVELPMKVLAWEDDSGQVWLAYVKPEVSQVGIFDRWPRRHIHGNGSGAREVDRRGDQAELTSGSSVGRPKDGVRLQWRRLSAISQD